MARIAFWFFDADHDPHDTATVNAGGDVDASQNRLERFGTAEGWPEGRRAGCPE